MKLGKNQKFIMSFFKDCCGRNWHAIDRNHTPTANAAKRLHARGLLELLQYKNATFWDARLTEKGLALKAGSQ